MSALDAAYAGITRVVTGLDDHDLLLPSGCHGWTIADLLLHVTHDAQRALVTVATPAAGPPDVDAVAVTLSTLEGLADLPDEWSELEKLRKSTGRAPLTDAERALGFPVLS